VATETKVDLLASRTTLRNLAERSRAEDMGLLDTIAIIRAQLMRMFLESSKAHRVHEATLISNRLQGILELQAKVSGELREHADGHGVHVNIMNGSIMNGSIQTTTADDEVARVQACVIRALRAHPAARADVIAALDAMGADAGTSPAKPARLGGNGLCIEHQTDDSMGPIRTARTPAPIEEAPA
jgi:hypothetical protein